MSGFGRIRHEDANIRRVILREEKMIVALPGGPSAFARQARPRASRPGQRDADHLPEGAAPQLCGPGACRHSRTARSKPRQIYEVRELQIALGLVAAGEGISVVPSSVYGLKRDDVSYKELDDPTLVSPIIMSMRALDESRDIREMLELIYRLYEEEHIPYTPRTDRGSDAPSIPRGYGTRRQRCWTGDYWARNTSATHPLRHFRYERPNHLRRSDSG